MSAENEMLTKIAEEVRKDVQDMREDLGFIKKCVESKQLRATISPDFTKCLNNPRESDKFSSRTKPSKLFKPNMLKIK